MALGHWSGGRCYWPGCTEKVFKDEAGEPYRTAAIAHIRGAYPGSARYEEEMSDDQRRSFSNLMLLCGPHHSIVDQDEQGYPAEELQRWKARHEAAAGEGNSDEAGFVAAYRGQVCALNGYLEPPNFERSSRVPAGDLYVPTQQVREVPGPGRPQPASQGTAPSLTVADLPRLIDRTVLLGDPGGGKTTAARMLMHSCASDPAARTPFLVSLGAYAAKAPPGCSIAEYIEHDLHATYECQPPDGLVERLLRAGSALVIFDGLDEFPDGPGRRGLSRRIELFCRAYPLAPVLVTSREIGYDRARLNGDQFTCYRLGEFSRSEVEEYARKWFADPAMAAVFLSDSADIRDLRPNPLLLSLMCSLYQDEGALPSSRAGLYERCASLLLRTWDKERGIRGRLPARVEVRALIRHLAWWLLNDRRPVVRESLVLAEAARFLQARGLGSADDAQDAAEEFVEFCRERTWVLNPGITAKGEKGYGFTHWTFLEYYAAGHIVTELCTTPEELAELLEHRIAGGEWSAVDLLTVSVMEQTTDGTADRVCEALLRPRRAAAPDCGELLRFLACLLDSAPPSTATARKVIREILRHRISYDPAREILHPLLHLTARWAAHQGLTSAEMSSYVSGGPGACRSCEGRVG
jgi:predicted NACHT family NTPase